MATTIGSSYKDNATGVTGKAVAQTSDPEGIILPDGSAVPITLTQLQLDPEFVGVVPDLRWYDDRKLTAITE